MAASRGDVIAELASQIGTPPLVAAEIDSVLALAAAAAHGTGDRTTAPLATFLAGVAAAASDDRVALLDELRRRTVELAPSSAGE